MSEAARRKRVLVVDDQPTLSRAIKRMLTEYDVTLAGSAREAIELVESGERFDVILSDLMMPEVSGMELHDTIAKVAPDQVGKMVFMTGGAFTERARLLLRQTGRPVLNKPCKREDIVDALAQLGIAPR